MKGSVKYQKRWLWWILNSNSKSCCHVMDALPSLLWLQAILAHLDELEMDHVDQGAEESDEEFEIEEDEEHLPAKKRRADYSSSKKRTTRSMAEQKHGAKTFAALLQEVQPTRTF